MDFDLRVRASGFAAGGFVDGSGGCGLEGFGVCGFVPEGSAGSGVCMVRVVSYLGIDSSGMKARTYWREL
jgi:hypothetical protein